MTHEMKLYSEPFEKIYSGIKTAEYRLFDQKRQKISVGDEIIFTNTESGEKLTATVTELTVYKSFYELFSARGGSECGCKGVSAEKLALSMREYYTPEDESRYGVVAIGIKLTGPHLNIIARVRNDFPTKFGLPRQAGLVEDIKGYIEFLPEYRVKEAFRGLDGYSHLWILWGFSLAEREGWSPTVRPPRLGGNTRMGVFATRSPFRPNSIGMSCVKIEKVDIQNCIIYISGADMCDGTPVYDIKPYLSFTDSHPDAVCGFADEKKDYAVEVHIPEELKEKIPPEKLQGLIGALSDDPRPAYKRDEEKEYGFSYAGKEIKFVSHSGVLTVTEIK